MKLTYILSSPVRPYSVNRQPLPVNNKINSIYGKIFSGPDDLGHGFEVARRQQQRQQQQPLGGQQPIRQQPIRQQPIQQQPIQQQQQPTTDNIRQEDSCTCAQTSNNQQTQPENNEEEQPIQQDSSDDDQETNFAKFSRRRIGQRERVKVTRKVKKLLVVRAKPSGISQQETVEQEPPEIESQSEKFDEQESGQL